MTLARIGSQVQVGSLATNETNPSKIAFAIRRLQEELNQNATVRSPLLGDTIYYVNAVSGNDANTGLSTSAAFSTPQKAFDTLYQTDLNGFSATVQLVSGAGPFAGFALSAPFVGGNVHLAGDGLTPGNCTIVGTVSLSGGALLYGSGVKFAVPGGVGLIVNSLSEMIFEGNHEFGACAIQQWASGGIIDGSMRPYVVSGGATYHALAEIGGVIKRVGSPVTVSGVPVFGAAWAWCVRGGVYWPQGSSWNGASSGSGLATGNPYYVDGFGLIDTAGQANNWLPCNVTAAAAAATGNGPGGLYR